MNILGLKCRVRIRKYRSYKGDIGKVVPNLINRNFHANAPNHKWTTDITEFSLFSRKLYLSPILDMYNGEIISYNISERPHLKQVMDMLNKALDKIADGTNLIFHSDLAYLNLSYCIFGSLKVLKSFARNLKNTYTTTIIIGSRAS